MASKANHRITPRSTNLIWLLCYIACYRLFLLISNLKTQIKMEDNIIKTDKGTIIFCSGNPLEGCPTDWEQAKNIIEKMNDGKTSNEPQWSFDCGFKLDYDGGLLSISSRFYPPKTHYGATWDGTVHVYLRDETIEEKKFDCQTLDELKRQVDEYINNIIEKVQSVFK